MSLIRRDPFREMMSLRSTMDRLFDNAFFSTQWDWEPESSQLALDLSETESEYWVKASIPGINPDDLDISFTGRTLTIKGEYKKEETKEDVHYHLRERRYGSFSRSVTLPVGVEADNIEARYESGVLTLRLPKTEEVKPKRIAVRSGETTKVLEGRAKDITGKN